MENMALTELAKNARRKYLREWYAKNKEKQKAANKRYWERKALAELDAEQNGNNENGEHAED